MVDCNNAGEVTVIDVSVDEEIQPHNSFVGNGMVIATDDRHGNEEMHVVTSNEIGASHCAGSFAVGYSSYSNVFELYHSKTKVRNLHEASYGADDGIVVTFGAP